MSPIEVIVVALTALGGGVGISRLLQARATNKKILAESDKTDLEASAIFVGATAVFSDTILKMLQQAQQSADAASASADRAIKESQKCKEEVAYMRRWIIEQGLTPPERKHT